MLGADVVVAELQGFAQRELQDLLGTRGERDVTRRSLRTLSDDLDDLRADGFEADAEALETASGDPFALVDQSEEDVLRPDVVVIEEARFLLCEDHDPSGPVGKPFKHAVSPLENLMAHGLALRPREYSHPRVLPRVAAPAVGTVPDRVHPSPTPLCECCLWCRQRGHER